MTSTLLKQKFNTCEKKLCVVLFTTATVAIYIEIIIVKATAPPAPPAPPVHVLAHVLHILQQGWRSI